MTNQPDNPNDNDSPQNMSADEFFGTEKDKAVAENNQRIQQMGGLVDELNESLHKAGLNINTKNMIVHVALAILPLSYHRKRYIQDKARRGETITITDVLFGDMSLGRIIRFGLGVLGFIVIAILSSRF